MHIQINIRYYSQNMNKYNANEIKIYELFTTEVYIISLIFNKVLILVYPGF